MHMIVRPPAVRLAAVAVCVAALALTACTRTVDGSLAGSAPSSAARSTQPTPTGTSTSGGDPLVALLEPTPTGCEPGHLAWDRNVTPTTAQFVAEFYNAADRTNEVAVLQSEGLQKVAHRVWLNDDDQFADVVLLQFATIAGATRRVSGIVDITAKDPTLTRTQLSARGTPTVFVAKKANSDGTVEARTYARVGRIVAEVFVDTDSPFDTQVNARWVEGQTSRLP